MSEDTKDTSNQDPYFIYYQVLSALAFEYPPIDIVSIIRENKLDLSLIIPIVDTSILHVISQKTNQVACAMMADIINERLVEADCLESKDAHGFTPILYAVRNQNDLMIEMLLSCEVDLSIPDGQGNTPLHLAVYGSREDYCELLASNGAPVDARNSSGFTPIDIATSNGLVDISSVLNKYLKVDNNDVKLYYADKAQSAYEKLGDDRNSRYGIYMKNMVQDPPYRKRMTFTIEHIQKIKSLQERFPNFSSVIDHITQELSLSYLSPTPYVRFKPILMYGVPGVGKTRFAIEVSKLLEVPIKTLDGGSLSSGFSLSGVNPTYKDAKPGAIADFLLEEEYLNGIIFLDEIDKLSAREESNQYAPLHKVLVSETASDFVDDFVGIPINASYLNWISTANDLDAIPKSIVSRFKTFDIPEPSKEQVGIIITSILSDIDKDPDMPWSEAFDLSLPLSVKDNLSSKPVRELKDIIYHGIAKAASEIVMHNVKGKSKRKSKIKLKAEFFDFKKVEGKRIGFL
jgi:ATP-dependent Lon protease